MEKHRNAFFWGIVLLFSSAVIMQAYSAGWLALVLHALTVIGGYFCFKDMMEDEVIALCLVGMYVFSVYYIFLTGVDRNIQGMAVMAFQPWVMSGFFQALEKGKREYSWIFWGVGNAGLLYFDFLSFVIMQAVSLIFMVFFIRQVKGKKILLNWLKGLAVGFFANGIVLYNLYVSGGIGQFIQIIENRDVYIQKKGLYVAQLFSFFVREGELLSGENGMKDVMPVGVNIILTGVFLLCAFLWLVRGFKGEQEGNKIKAVLLSSALFLFLSLNLFPWDLLQEKNMIIQNIVQWIERPDYFIKQATLFLVILYGLVLKNIKSYREGKWYYVGVVLVFVSVLVSGVFMCEQCVQAESGESIGQILRMEEKR